MGLNQAVTGTYGVPGLKAAMNMRGAPAGFSRSPHRESDSEARSALQKMILDLEL